MSKSTGAIEFYDLSTRKKIWVPRGQCKLEEFETSRGKRRRLIATIADDPDNPSATRKVSKLCSASFEL